MEKNSHHHENHTQAGERSPSLTELRRDGTVLIAAYKNLIKSHLKLMGNRLRVNLKTLFISLAIIWFSLILATCVWVSLNVMLSYGLIQIGMHWLLSTVLVLSLNIVGIRYLLKTGVVLFNQSLSQLTSVFDIQ
ncbi:hypothetical protein [Thalassotalea marina]|uniref:Uncharacterized protein n=1 Tax=Thalassotalea marina TaxID=1673741 RepID=A0A919EJM4_9GAMM|nr:hypothetical protein [Thalassotalea marina]GHF88564.1 hypothetical protein GCM10017161_15380 [Thalassotalea marina]